MLLVVQGLMLVGRYRYDGLYVVDKVSVNLASGCTLILAQAEMRRGLEGYMMCFFELSRINEGNGPLPYRSRRTLKVLKDMFKEPKT